MIQKLLYVAKVERPKQSVFYYIKFLFYDSKQLYSTPESFKNVALYCIYKTDYNVNFLILTFCFIRTENTRDLMSTVLESRGLLKNKIIPISSKFVTNNPSNQINKTNRTKKKTLRKQCKTSHEKIE